MNIKFYDLLVENDFTEIELNDDGETYSATHNNYRFRDLHPQFSEELNSEGEQEIVGILMTVPLKFLEKVE